MRGISENFIDRVKREITVDTKKYRYTIMSRGGVIGIMRIKSDMLDTAAALMWKNWELVEILATPEF